MHLSTRKKTFIVALSLSVIFALLSILLIIVGAAKTSPGHTYLATGAYFLDYFYYLQFIAQGMRGHFLPQLLSTTDDPFIYFNLEPYLVIGQLFRLFPISPVAVYWLSVFVLNTVYFLLIFYIIRQIIRHKPLFFQVGAFVVTLIMAPFFNSKGAPYDFWFSPSTFFKRFGGIPHHLLADILIIVAILILAKHLAKPTFYYAVFLIILLSVIFTFYPYIVVTYLLTLGLATIIYFLKSRNLSLIFFNLIIFGTMFIFANIIKSLYYQTPMFQAAKGIELAWTQRLPISTLIINLGPAVVFAVAGIFAYFKPPTPLKIIVCLFTLSTYILFLSPVNQYLNTHNARFLSPLSYIFFGIAAVLGIGQIGRAFGLILMLLIAVSLPPNWYDFKAMIQDPNIFSRITYLPSPLIDGLKSLNNQPASGNVLTAPALNLGVIVPVFTGRRVYIAREIATHNFAEKNNMADQFYSGKMTVQQAYHFLSQNNLRFVILTPYEGYNFHTLNQYSFLKEIYRNKDVRIYEIVNYEQT